METSTLFLALPDYISTPDGMAIDRYGNLVLSCPNFAEETSSGCIVKIDKEKKVTKWFDVPPHPETGVARNMGIAFDDDYNIYICDNQGWSEKPELIYKGRVLKITVDDDGHILKTVIVAHNMEHPNGIRIKDGYMYVTQSYLHPAKHPSGKLLSGVYRFSLDDENIKINNTLEDHNLLTTFITHNLDCQYGADGIAFDRNGDLFVGNFGDATIHKITFNQDGSVNENVIFAGDFTQMESTDGMIFDHRGNLYVADFCSNAIGMVTPEGKVSRLAQSPDSDGLHGELDQPGEPIVWHNKIIVSCFDLVTGPGKVNTGHTMPATLAQLNLPE